MRNNFSSSNEVFEWLSKFINLERGQKPKSFRLERMETLAELAGNPHRCAPSIHIAGSKGKGSVTSMLAAILAAAGYRTARYMSPHVIDIRERVCLNGSFFSEDIYCSAGAELRRVTEEILPLSVKSNPLAAELFDTGGEPTYWELLTLFFFLCARLSECDVMVTETGMGGRLDSTNIIDSAVSVITLIELEHTGILGDTIAAIAGEKAGIIKKGRPLILANQCGQALEVFRKKAQETESRLYYFPEISALTDINVTSRGTSFSLSLNLAENENHIFNSSFSVPIPGKVQAENAALAAAAVKIAFPQINIDAVSSGLSNVNIPARFENIQDESSPFIIDGAHTPESLEQCVETFCALYGNKGVLIFGCASDKDVSSMARIAASHFSKIIITTPGLFKTSYPEKIFETFKQAEKKVKILLIKDTREAVRQAVNNAKENRLPILGTGSFYLVSEIRSFCIGNGNIAVSN